MRAAIACLLLAAVASTLYAREQHRTWRNPRDGAVYVWIPPGELEAGNEIYRFAGFWMSRTEVTVEQFRKFVAATGYVTKAEAAGAGASWRNPGFAQDGRHPVVWLNFDDAVAYSRWAGVDLPTEAEWLYAQRAGTASRFFWGNDHDNRYMWHRENSPDGTQPVGRKLPNAWGLYDMVGNAWEFVRVQTPSGRICENASAQLGASWTRCPQYQMRDGRIIDAIYLSLGPVRTECPQPPRLADDNPWDDDRGIRCVRRVTRTR
jgi:formylglycine-generating enzyme required for sulfatase activity